jgi:GT2 family glycosyltransferase
MEILAIMVRYKVPLEQSETLRTVSAEFESSADLKSRATVLVWDNSPTALSNPQFPFPSLYRHAAENVGVAGAYNRGLEIAHSHGCQWLLLLDQDTTVPRGFIQRLLDYATELHSQREIAGVVPIVRSGDRVSSPYIQRLSRPKYVVPPSRGVQSGRLIAHNSGALLRVDALREIGGFDEAFWLDYSDIVLFSRLHASGKRIYVAGDLEVQHKISIADYDRQLSIERYNNLLHAESSFWDIYHPAPMRLIHILRLLVRALRQALFLQNKAFGAATFRHLLRNVCLSRKRRLQQWRQVSLHRNLPQIDEGRRITG